MSATKDWNRTNEKYEIELAGARAARTLAELRATLPLDPDMEPIEVRATMGYRRVPDEAIALAAAILERDGARYPHLDARVPGEALAYQRGLKAALVEARALVKAMERTIAKKKWTAARDAAVLYASMKAVAMVGAGQRERDEIEEMKRVLAGKEMRIAEDREARGDSFERDG